MRVLVLLLVAGCGRLEFAGITDADPDADAIAARCGTAVICDDFEDDTFKPWTLHVGGGTMGVMPGCGSAGSRCARSAVTTGEYARFEFATSSVATGLSFEGTAIVRTAGPSDGQLFAFDLSGVFDTLPSWQIGIAALPAGLRVYDYNFAAESTTFTIGSAAMPLDVPVRLALVFDLTAKTATLYRDGAPVVSHTLAVSIDSTRINPLLGLYVGQEPGWVVDFDEVAVRRYP